MPKRGTLSIRLKSLTSRGVVPPSMSKTIDLSVVTRADVLALQTAARQSVDPTRPGVRALPSMAGFPHPADVIRSRALIRPTFGCLTRKKSIEVPPSDFQTSGLISPTGFGYITSAFFIAYSSNLPHLNRRDHGLPSHDPAEVIPTLVWQVKCIRRCLNDIAVARCAYLQRELFPKSFSGPRSQKTHLLTIYLQQHNQALKPRLSYILTE